MVPNLFRYITFQKDVNNSNVVETAEQVKNLSSVTPEETLKDGDITNIATILEKIVSVKEDANEVSYIYLLYSRQ